MKRLGLLRLLVMLAEGILIFVLPVLVFGVRNSVFDSGLVAFLLVFPKLISYPIAGFLSDRGLEIKAFKRTSVARALISSVAFLSLSDIAISPQCQSSKFAILVVFMVLAACDGFLSGVSTVTFDTAVPRLLDASLLISAQALIQGADQLAVIAGPALGGYVLSWVQGRYVLLVTGLFFALSALLALCPNHSTQAKRAGLSLKPRLFVAGLKSEFVLTLRLLAGSRALLILVVLTLIDNFVLGLQAAIAAPLTLGVFGRSEAELGAAMSIGGLAALASVIIGPYLVRKSSVTSVWIGSYIIGYFGFLMVGMARNFLTFGIALGLVEMSCGIGIYALRLIRTQLIPDKNLGSTLGMLYLLQQSTIPLAGVLVARASGVHGLQSLMLGSTIGSGVIVAVLLLGTLSELRRAFTPDARVS